MFTLTLFRHAKSSWDEPSLEDFDRPLAPRGRKAAPRMAAALRRERVVPDLILCSPALRTRQTLALVLGTVADLMPRHAVLFDRRVYHGTPDELLALLADVGPREAHVMLVGHNPGLHDLAVRMIGDGSDLDRRAIATKLPTTAVVVIDFPTISAWGTIATGSGKLRLFMTPATEEGRTDDPADR